MEHISISFHGSADAFERLLDRVVIGHSINLQLEQLMANFTQLSESFEGLKTTLATEIEQINTKIADALAQSGTLEQREALLADIQATTTKIAGIIEDAEPPVEEPPTEPV